MYNKVKTQQEIEAMREGGRMLATVLNLLRTETKIGLTPKDMSKIAGRELAKLGGEPATKGYQGYPDIICISVNNQVQHCIPNNRPFHSGDVVNYDFCVRYKNLITDAGTTVGVGQISPDSRRLLEGTARALEAGLAVVRDGCRVGDISAAIEQVVSQHKLAIVEDLAGHGVGHYLHEEPTISNSGKPGQGPILLAGMTIAIEPITTLGRGDIAVEADGWSLVTTDGSWSAQFEHTILITEHGCEILTSLA